MAVRKTKKKKATRAKARKPAKAKKRVVKRAVKARVSKKAVKPKRVVKRTAKPKAVVKEVKFKGKQVGKVTHYFGNIGVAVIELSGTLKEGDDITVKGATSDFTQKATSMQIDHEKVDEAKKGQSIGLKVKKHARQNDVVYKV